MFVQLLEKMAERAHSPQRAMMQSLQSAHAIWTKRYPEWEATFFDAHFLHHHVIPHFSAGEMPTAEMLAELWVTQLGATGEQAVELMAELTPVAVDFLYVVKGEYSFCIERTERNWRGLRWVIALLSGQSTPRGVGGLS